MPPKPTVLVTRKLPDAVEARLARDYDARLNASDKLLSAEEIVAGAQSADALLPCPTCKVTADMIRRFPSRLKAIATFSVGYEHIDVKAAKERGIAVGNTPDVLTDATADIALLLMLGAARGASEGERAVREATWGAWAPTGMLGVHMTGKRLGIYGMGRIGQAVAKRARAFDMKIHYHNRSRLPRDLEQGAVFHERAEDMLPHCDFLSLNAPATPETTGFLNAQRIKLLPDGAIVVNTARGPLVDDEALIAALKSGKLFAAGLDVYTGEPAINPAYRTVRNAFLLPHLGSATTETRIAMGMKAVDNLDAFFAGKPMPAKVV
ncbi:MAG TPA: D-glycerate dehydrogenase [Hypericibacter adhaerens]|jgi:glyoxylate reductase|uniref:D-glycerate dehydrogenase n=1 Tax=Hypericibacter adhaerens TaxID=2602016 RepID=A0A5J6N2E6_9PROT|nr:D-glycerate dehydrogenase [Hypericibacter adhaerens]QEX23123.1 D-glycerate dehydrogenase [Hypericibacter adhaerens]HWA45022.1 D-glycerate dehydrogenase [Hypericibacter adhaerens]